MTVEQCLNHPWINQTMNIIPNPLNSLTVTHSYNPLINQPVTILSTSLNYQKDLKIFHSVQRWKVSLNGLKILIQKFLF